MTAQQTRHYMPEDAVGDHEPFSPGHLLRLFTTAPGAFWRFDVDVSLPAAARMARFARLAGVQGRFYVMMAGEAYNPLAEPSLRALDEILSLGHRLGLHCDYQPGQRFTAPELVARDGEIMRRALQTLRAPTATRDEARHFVSFHMPPDSVLWRSYQSFESAYHHRWRGRYISDSRREWGPDKDALVSDSMQINLHPEHWTGP